MTGAAILAVCTCWVGLPEASTLLWQLAQLAVMPR